MDTGVVGVYRAGIVTIDNPVTIDVSRLPRVLDTGVSCILRTWVDRVRGSVAIAIYRYVARICRIERTGVVAIPQAIPVTVRSDGTVGRCIVRAGIVGVGDSIAIVIFTCDFNSDIDFCFRRLRRRGFTNRLFGRWCWIIDTCYIMRLNRRDNNGDDRQNRQPRLGLQLDLNQYRTQQIGSTAH